MRALLGGVSSFFLERSSFVGEGEGFLSLLRCSASSIFFGFSLRHGSTGDAGRLLGLSRDLRGGDGLLIKKR